MKGIGKRNTSLTFNDIDGDLNNNRVSGLIEEMTAIAAQGIKLYKLSLNKDNWIFNGASAGQTQYINNWHFYRYNTLGTTPTLAQANNAAYTAERYYADEVVNYSPGIAYGDSYSAKCVTYLYCDENKTLNFKFVTDDAGTVYLNGVQIATLASCVWSSNIACNFKKGWNELIVIYTEGSGGDGWDTSPKLYNNSDFRLMCADLGGVFEQVVNAEPIGHNIPLTDDMVLTNLMYIPIGDNTIDEINKYDIDGLNKGVITAKTNQISIQTIGNSPTNDLICYILAKETK